MKSTNLKRSLLMLVFLLGMACTAAGQTIFVDADAPGPTHNGSSWTAAFKYLQDALAAATSGDEIWAAEGTYKPDHGVAITPGDRNATFRLINGVTIKGGYAGFGETDPNARDIEAYNTSLSGNIGAFYSGDNSYHVVTGNETDATAVLDGFTITYGSANGNWSDKTNCGAGMYNNNGSPAILNCTFSNNSADQKGGGMCNYNRSRPTLTDCTFSGNFSDYDGGGICNDYHSRPTLRNCTITGNRAFNGSGMCNSDSSATLVNCLFADNVGISYGHGGGMYNSGTGYPTLTNCTFSGNSPYGIYNNLGWVGMTVRNCILWGDTPEEIYWSGPLDGWVAITYSDVQTGGGAWYGEGNIEADPLFADPENGDYHLKSEFGRWDPAMWQWVLDTVTSPCIDAGDPTAGYANEPFPNGQRINMGAYGNTLQASKSSFSLSETSATESTLFETIVSQKADLNNVTVSGDFNSTLDFTSFEIVTITTGSFAGKGFSKAQCVTDLGGIVYKGDWKGVTFLKPGERKIYLKGAVSGEIFATVEGYLTESVPDSNVYDEYQATWKIGRLGDTVTSATINLNGNISYHTDSNFPETELYVLQSNIEETVLGEHGGSLSIVLTHVRVVSQDNPYSGEGFSIISYISDSGAGQGWTCDELVSPGTVELKGLFTGPLFGIAFGTLNESKLPRSLSLTLHRVDLGLPPAPDLKIRVWGPTYIGISPGQRLTYVIEYRNDGLKEATEAIVSFYPDLLLKFVSASSGFYYDPYLHQTSWNLGRLPAKRYGYLGVQLEVPWGLPGRYILKSSAYVSDIVLHSTEENGFVNGICYNSENEDSKKIYRQFVSDNNARWIELYDKTNFISGSLDAFLASNDIHTSTNGVGEISEVSGYRPKWIGYSAGATTLLNQAKSGRISGEELILISPQLTSQEDLQLLKSQFNRISIYQGDDLIPDEIKRLRIDETGIYLKLDQAEIEVSGIPAISVAKFLLPDLLDKVEQLEGKDITAIELFGAEPGNSIKFVWEDGSSSEFVTTHAIQPEEGIDVITLSGVGHTQWIDVLNKFRKKYYRLPTSNDINKLRQVLEDIRQDESSKISTAHDPNRKLGPKGRVLPTQRLSYNVEYENEGEGIAFGVYFTDTLDEDLDDSTLGIGPVIDVNTGSLIAGPGTYNPATRTITWFVGQVDPNQGGYADLSANVRENAPHGTEIINFATVYFPSVPEETRTNGIVSIVANPCVEALRLEGYELVDEKRISRTELEYNFRLRAGNSSIRDVRDITVQLTGVPNNTVVLDDTVEFSFIEAGAAALSDDTFRIRTNRSIEGAESDVVWEICDCKIDWGADLNYDWSVNFEDYALLAEVWLSTGVNMPQDLNLDSRIDLMDLLIFSQEWLK